MPWAKQYDETDVLERAMEAFWSRGFAATSINDLVAATGINRGSLYAAYTDKRSLFISALGHYDKLYRQDFLDTLEREHPPREAILSAFRNVAAGSDNGRNRKGCLLVNTALEVSPHDPEIGRLVARGLRGAEDFFKSMLDAAQREGTVRKDISSTQTAQVLFSLFLGMRVITRSGPDKSLMNTIIQQAEAVLD